jgi:hypothetical protein
MPFVQDYVAVKSNQDGSWKLLEPLEYKGSKECFVTDPDFCTDFASVPRAVQWLIPSTGQYTLAAVMHDWFCVWGISRGIVSARDADGLFRRMMRELGVPPIRRWMMWAGVRWGAIFTDNKVRRAGVSRDLPLMLAISIAVSPLVIPGALIVAILQSIDWLANKI